MLYKLAEKIGVFRRYRCFLTNSDHETPVASMKKILQSMDFLVEDDESIANEIKNLEKKEWTRILPPVIAIRTSNLPLRLELCFNAFEIEKNFEYEILFENGNIFKGGFVPSNLKHLSEANFDGELFYKKELILNIDAEWGYHSLKIKVKGGEEKTDTLLIIAPLQAYKPDNLKHWGIPVQLYSIKSKRNWGIGDFTDLKGVINNSAKLGASLIGLNPMTSLKPHEPENASPYSVSSRLYLNTIYIDPDNIKESKKCEEYKEFVQSKEFKDGIKKARESEFVDYSLVNELKMKALKIIFKYMIDKKGKSVEAFKEFVKEEGSDLTSLATYQAICFAFKTMPDEYKDLNSKIVKLWSEKNKNEITFFSWLQWIATYQFKEAGLACFDNHMRIGIYQDLAVGVSHDSAEAWAYPKMFLKGVSIGSPPDGFCSDGQNWGLSPMNPLLLKEEKYRYFIKIIRQSMLESGALRIDHAMGLQRLFFIPDKGVGTYVNYPFSDLLTIIVLESHKNSCVVIGEDLGNMPEGFSYAMNSSGILSMVVGRWIMEYNELPEIAFKDRYMSLLAFSNHDMPTIPAYWKSKDIDLLKEFNFIKSEDEVQRLKQNREKEKRRLIVNLSRNGLFFNDGEDLPINLVYSIYEYLSRSPNYLFLPQLEDILGQEQQINLPGTDREHKNWRYKLSSPVEDWLYDKRILKLSKIMKEKYSV